MVKLYLDTSTDIVELKLDDHSYTWETQRNMARDLLGFIHEQLQSLGQDWSDISAITFFSGPGSFTGLRIGAAIVNTLADQLDIPLFDHHGVRHDIILPEYGRPANISAPKK